MSPLDFAWRWSQLLVAIALVIVEWVSRGAISLVFRFIPVPWKNEHEDPKKHIEDANCECSTTEYIISKGYNVEEHFVTTPDGYILGLHRIPSDPHSPRSHHFNTSSSSSSSSSSSGDYTNNDDDERESVDGADEPTTVYPIRPVLIVHGFMHSSEAFIRLNASDSLPLVLNEAGYDVWLGNNRGNKYSHKHVSKKPTQDEFWDFSLDDMARYDLPSMIDYVLAQTGAPSLTLMGFSQGTAQSFAYLSNHRISSSKVNLFIALAPVIVPRGFANPVVDNLARARPDFIFLLFGRRQLLPSTLFWRNNLPRANFVQVIDCALKFLFGWDTSCLSEKEKPLLYSHIYAHASVKTVVQWFQIIQSGKFQMFDDYKSDNLSTNAGSDSYPGYVLPTYQVQQIKTPVACFCGGKDTLPHTADIINAIPADKRALIHVEEKYEHLDFMWASDLATTVFPKILNLLHQYNGPKEEDCCEL